MSMIQQKLVLSKYFILDRSERYMTLKGSYLSRNSSTIRSEREQTGRSLEMKSPAKKTAAQYYNRN